MGWGWSGRIWCRFGVGGALSHSASCGATRGRIGGSPCGRPGAELVMLARYGSKRASARLQKAAIAASGVRVFFLVWGRPSRGSSETSQGFEVQSFQSSVHSGTCCPGTCCHWTGDRRMEAAVGVGRSRHRRVEGQCSPTSAGVRRRPEPSLQRGCAIRSRSGPGRTPALSPPAGRLALRVGGQAGTACLDRAARHVSFIGLEPCPQGTTTCPGGWRRNLAKACAARGGAAGAVLGRHGGG